MKFKFEHKDFMEEMCDHCYCDAVEIANKKLKEWLDKAIKVTGSLDEDLKMWAFGELYIDTDTHKAKLIFIEEIK